MTRYFAIIPAAGTGLRMQADKPKQYLLLNGKPLLTHVVDAFTSHPAIEKVLVVLATDDVWWPTLSFAHPEKIITTIGGKERVHSVSLALSFLSDFAAENDWVLVHDAARPFIQRDDITRLISELRDDTVGGLLAVPAVDTIKKVDDENRVIATVSREKLWCAQTPQCFRYQLLCSAIENALSKNKIVTDESSAVELLGLKPKIVLGNARNKKITFPEDV